MAENPYQPPRTVEPPQGRKVSFRGLCLFLMVAAICAMPIGAFIGIESGFDTPLPIEQTLHRKVIAKRIVFSAAGIALAVAVGLYVADRRRPSGR
jgi:hypothetical protein